MRPKTLSIQVFVVSPFGADGSDERRRSDWIMDELLSAVSIHCRTVGIEVLFSRAIDLSTDSLFPHEAMRKTLRDADLCFADLGDPTQPLNLNVVFEIGFRLGVGRPIVLLQESADGSHDNHRSLPFDIGPCEKATFSSGGDERAVATRKACRLTLIPYLQKHADRLYHDIDRKSDAITPELIRLLAPYIKQYQNNESPPETTAAPSAIANDDTGNKN